MSYDVSEGIPAKVRMAVLVRDGFRCQRCLIDKESGGKMEVHHIVKRRDSGTHEMENLITYCTNCHKDEERDRTKPVCTIGLDIPWDLYEQFKPLYIKKQISLKRLIESGLAKLLADLQTE